jgi:hypothetical protein
VGQQVLQRVVVGDRDGGDWVRVVLQGERGDLEVGLREPGFPQGPRRALDRLQGCGVHVVDLEAGGQEAFPLGMGAAPGADLAGHGPGGPASGGIGAPSALEDRRGVQDQDTFWGCVVPLSGHTDPKPQLPYKQSEGANDEFISTTL